MTNFRKPFVWALLILLICTGCSGSSLPTLSPVATMQSTASQASTSPTDNPVQAYRECAFGFGEPPIISEHPVLKPTPTPSPTLPANQVVDAATTDQQLEAYQEIWNQINTRFVSTDFNGKDWPAIGKKYAELIRKGWTQADFYTAMQDMARELEDPYTFFIPPSQPADQNPELENAGSIGVYGYIEGENFVISAVLPGSPAEKAGLKAHDLLLKVDGGPVLDANKAPRIGGELGSSVNFTVKSPGQQSREVTLTREQVGFISVLSCRFSEEQIGYISILDWNDPGLYDQTVNTIRAMAEVAPLKGLILDDRQSGGYQFYFMRDFLSLFTQGEIGDFITRDRNVDTSVMTDLVPIDLAGSQTVPLVVITHPENDSIVNTVAGILQNTHRAKLVGVPMSGIFGLSSVYSIPGGGQIAVHDRSFQPTGLPVDAWGRNGKIEPDALVTASWLDYTEENDPYIAKAMELLKQ